MHSYGHKKCSDYNLDKEFLTSSRKCFAERKKTEKNVYLKKIDLHKVPIVSVTVVLTTPLKFSVQSPRMIKKLILFSKNLIFVFPQYVPMDTKYAVITTSLKSCRRKAENFSLKVQKW